jgi:hypothetical protein
MGVQAWWYWRAGGAGSSAGCFARPARRAPRREMVLRALLGAPAGDDAGHPNVVITAGHDSDSRNGEVRADVPTRCRCGRRAAPLIRGVGAGSPTPEPADCEARTTTGRNAELAGRPIPPRGEPPRALLQRAPASVLRGHLAARSADGLFQVEHHPNRGLSLRCRLNPSRRTGIALRRGRADGSHGSTIVRPHWSGVSQDRMTQ